ncbi:hypothetical protein CQJ34_26090, partial [Salmonella enterica subsp. enterica serovar Heidelberg]
LGEQAGVGRATRPADGGEARRQLAPRLQSVTVWGPPRGHQGRVPSRSVTVPVGAATPVATRPVATDL